MVQYAVLRWAADYPDLADWTDNIRILETLGRHRLLPGEAAADLTETYKDLRSAYHRSALQDQPRRSRTISSSPSGNGSRGCGIPCWGTDPRTGPNQTGRGPWPRPNRSTTWRRWRTVTA